ncbi:unnamed protein product, partial [Discosporangium mesarthrocarpum]
QVLTYFPTVLQYSTENLAGKIKTLCSLLPRNTARSVILRLPKCLAVSASTVTERVTALQGVFPGVDAARLVDGAPWLVAKRVDLDSQVQTIRELFPSLNPAQVVEGAPMLLVLSQETLTTKAHLWGNVLGAALAAPWEEV